VPRAERHATLPDVWTIQDTSTITHVHESTLRDDHWGETLFPGGKVTHGHAIALIEAAKLREHSDRQQVEIERLTAHDEVLKDFRIKVCRALKLDPVEDDKDLLLAASGLRSGAEDAIKLREENEVLRNGRLSDPMLEATVGPILANGNRVAAALGLPEGADVEAVLARINESQDTLNGVRLALLRRKIQEALGWTDELMQNCEWWTTISCFRDFWVKVREIVGGCDNQSDDRVLERLKEIQELSEARLKSEQRLQWESLNWEKYAKLLADVCAAPVAEFIAELRRIFRTTASADREKVLEFARETEKERLEWRKRALAAEARLVGGPGLSDDPKTLVEEGILALYGSREVLGPIANIQHAIDSLKKLKAKL